MIEWRSETHSLEAEAAWASLSEEEREEAKRAASKAMQLLLYRQRTEKELRERLKEKAFSSAAVDAAVSYVSSYGYLDDLHFAEVYLHSMQEKKSRRQIRRELLEKGVSAEYVDTVFADSPEEEEETAFALLSKKAGEPHTLEEKEVRRFVQFLARRGFSSAVIWHAIERYRSLSSS